MRPLVRLITLFAFAATLSFAGSITFNSSFHLSGTPSANPFQVAGEYVVSWNPVSSSSPQMVITGWSNGQQVTVFSPLDDLFTSSFGLHPGDPGDTSINYLLITVTGGFTDFTADLQGVFSGHPAVDFLFITNQGIFSLTEMLTVDPTGQPGSDNYVQFIASPGIIIYGVAIGSIDKYFSDAANDTKFNAFGDLAFSFAPVPEPGSLLLFATGIGGLGFTLRRRFA